MAGSATACLTAPDGGGTTPERDGGAEADARSGCVLYDFASDADIGFDQSAGCDIEVTGGRLVLTHESDSGCWIELESQYPMSADGWVSVHYGHESDLSVVLELYSPTANVVVNRWGTTIELDWYLPGDDVNQHQIDTTDFDDRWVVWRVSGLDGAIAVSAGPDEESLETRLSGPVDFDRSEVGVIIGSWDDRAEPLEASFDDLEICP
jgi:hypothetical protein